MRKINLTVLFLFYCLILKAQLEPNPTSNYYVDRAFWSNYYDSVKAYNLENGIDTKIPGLTSFIRWRDYWDLYMPSSGSYGDAMEIMRQNLDHLKKVHFETYSTNNGANALVVNPVVWEELGPKNISKIKTKKDGVWNDTHLNNDGSNPSWDNNNANLQSAAHVAKIDRLFQHPTQSNIIYACAGGIDAGGGGLFVSNDYGQNWDILGTDQIPNPDIMTFGVKPLGATPNPATEYLFVGLSTGAVYRSTDNGLNWIECNYYGNYQYPYWNSNPLLPNSLPYDNTSQNFSYTTTEKNTDLKFAKLNAASNDFDRLVITRNGGVYFSDNYFATLSPSGNMINNSIVWQNMTDGVGDNFNAIQSDIPIYNVATVDREFHFTDFETFTKNGNTYYLVHFQVKELDLAGLGLGNVRQYVCVSQDFGMTWLFLGNQVSANGPHGEEASAKYTPGNIEVLKQNPTYIYVASTTLGGIVQDSYSLKRYNIDLGIWEDYSVYNGFYNQLMITQPHGFAIDPNNEENWWFFTNSIHKMKSGVLEIPTYKYSTYHHADARDVLVLQQGIILVATDGGVYQAPIGPNDHVLNATSEGLNAAQSNRIGLAQRPPFYVASGFWHSGLQVYNPEQDVWHWGIVQDGAFGEVFFLNNERFALSNQTYNIKVVKNFNDLTSISVGGIVAPSENIYGRTYGIKRIGVNDILSYNNDDFTAPNSNLISLSMSYPKFQAQPKVIPNEPDKVAVNVNEANGQFIYLYEGCNAITPSPVLVETIDVQDVYESLGGDDLANLGSYEFDARKNGRFWIILKGNPVWGSSYQGARIAEYDPNAGYSDLTFPTDDDFNNSSFFPNWLSITDIKHDRQTGVLYLGTTNGVYYLDRDNSIWRKYSVNVPLFNTNLGIRHCTGELFVSSTNRGIWHTDLIRSNDAPTQEWKITGNDIWQERVNLFCNLVIEPGAVLTVKDELVVFGNQRIIVKAGGKLIIDGGRLTSECGDYWSGIEIWGNSNLSQSPANQGYLITKNNAIIENAKEAVRVWEPGNWNSTGGILLCSNTTFKNNWRSVEYIRYHSYHPANQNIELVNKGRFTNCLFTWDDNFIDGSAAPAPAMTMYHVYGVQVRGCDFIDDRTIANLQRTTGIYTIDAGYRVIGQYTGGGIFYPTSFPQDEYYSETDYNVSHFKNLKAGVHAMNATTLYNVMVDHSKFENDSYGIIIDGVDDAILTRNKFDFNSSHPSDISSMYQLSSRESSAYTVEGNLFYRTDPFGAAGTYIKNSGPDNNQVYDNYYEGLNVGNWADGFNSNDQSNFLNSSGLQWLCNKNDQGYIDFLDYVSVYDPSLNGEGVRLLQGSLYEAAGNTFSSNITLGAPVSDAHIYQIDQDFMAYYYFPGVDKFPTVITGSAGAVLSSFDNECPSNFTNNLVVAENILINSAIKPAMQTRLDEIDQELITKNQELDSLLSSGDAQSLHQLIEDLTYQNRQQTKDALLQASPYLSQSLLEELGLQQPSLFPHSWYKEIIEANIEVARHNSFMESLLTKPFPMPSGMYQAIYDDRYSTFTVRGYKEMDILELNKEREVIMNLFIADEMSDSTSVDWLAVKQILMERDHIECKRQVADYHLSREEIPNCTNMLDLIELQLATYDMERVQQELQDFVDFKRYLLTITDNTGIIKQLHQSEIQQLDYMATNFEGKAARQARNILCFFEGMCEEIDLVIPEAGQNNNRTMSPEDQPIFNDMLKLKIVPNPNEGTFKLIVPEECSISELTVVDINGKVIQHELIETEDNSIRIRLLDASAGVHLLSVSCIDGSIFTNRVLVNK